MTWLVTKNEFLYKNKNIPVEVVVVRGVVFETVRVCDGVVVAGGAVVAFAGVGGNPSASLVIEDNPFT